MTEWHRRLEELWRRVKRLEQGSGTALSLRWCVVSATSPLTVTEPGTTAPIYIDRSTVPLASMTAGSTTVLVAKQAGAWWIIGRREI